MIWKTPRVRWPGAAHCLIVATALAASTASAEDEHTMEEFYLKDARGMRYCEIGLIFDHGADIYNTSASAGCPEDKWQALDVDALAEEHGARGAFLNGPKFWATDEQTINLAETKSFGGIEARYGATLPAEALAESESAQAYAGFTSTKKQTLIFKAGRPVYELVDPEGNTYILNAYGAEVKDGDPANLASQLSPAEGWSFRVVTPEEDLIVQPPAEGLTQMVGDDMHQYYTRHGKVGQ
ncbi:hypothetical protein CLV78_101355 [Aliiruegeria haliotis]|uniref:Protease inhibitor Inh n=1 Tax=Aliiruegeria haliotis TaxID=1280846 RepID=A0A2T0RYM3_9RHOB|nr:hypothetical protein [Aliiruegeria haliotis]PRY26260.1 hypothetical protein CLV78_101355 [Aliiruegeria haliotis]